MFQPINILGYKTIELLVLIIREYDSMLYRINFEADWEAVQNFYTTLELINMVPTDNFCCGYEDEGFLPKSVNLVYKIEGDDSSVSFATVVSKKFKTSLSESDVLDEVLDIAWLLTETDLRSKIFETVRNYHKK